MAASHIEKESQRSNGKNRFLVRMGRVKGIDKNNICYTPLGSECNVPMGCFLGKKPTPSLVLEKAAMISEAGE